MKTNTVRLFTGLLGVIALVTGGEAMLLGLGDVDVPALLDNTYRFLAGIWFGAGCGLVYCVLNIESSTLLLRSLMLAIFLGGIARLIGLPEYEVIEPQFMVAIAIELFFPPLIVGLQSGLDQPSNVKAS